MGVDILSLTELTAGNSASNDALVIVDISDTSQDPSGTTKFIERDSLPFLKNGDNVSELANDAGYQTASDFSNNGEAAGANRDLGNTDAFSLSFITSGTGRINILSTGEVGIGTSTPTVKLEVVGSALINGNIAIDSATGAKAFSVASALSGGSAIVYTISSNTGTTETILQEQKAGGVWEIGSNVGGTGNSFQWEGQGLILNTDTQNIAKIKVNNANGDIFTIGRGGELHAGITSAYMEFDITGGLVVRSFANNGDAITVKDTGDVVRFQVLENGNCNALTYSVGSNQVVGAQAAAVVDTTDVTDVATQLNDLLAKLRTHGLIA